MFVPGILTWGLSGILFAPFYNKLYVEELIGKGYVLKPGTGADHLKISNQLGITLPVQKLEAQELKKCLYCAEYIKEEAIVCRYCGKEMPKLDPIVNDRDDTPLIVAARNGDIGKVIELLQDGANKYQKNMWSSDALMVAERAGHHEIVKLLVTGLDKAP